MTSLLNKANELYNGLINNTGFTKIVHQRLLDVEISDSGAVPSLC
jgi:hypothetical protein